MINPRIVRSGLVCFCLIVLVSAGIVMSSAASAQDNQTRFSYVGLSDTIVRVDSWRGTAWVLKSKVHPSMTVSGSPQSQWQWVPVNIQQTSATHAPAESK